MGNYRNSALMWTYWRGQPDARTSTWRARANIRSSPPLKIGEYVWMQNHKSLKWNIAAKVIDIRPNQKSYWVKVVTGKVFLRNRMFLRKWNARNAKNAPEQKLPQKQAAAPLVQQHFVHPGVATRSQVLTQPRGEGIARAPVPAVLQPHMMTQGVTKNESYADVA